ncbi:class I SAM-dependent methyltransferase [Geojedonia litorea]|uniref:Class I SAM-dependent methyltransferase n=1 Tax=Geojedonia litorea TaxID=1268269 RepID=A0ABV9N2Z4_9FLAO
MKLQDNIASEFNEFSKNYTDDMVKCVPYYLQLLSQFTLDIPTDFHPKRILDLGCGNGNVTSKLLEKFPEAHYTLLDASDQMLELCKSYFGLENKSYVQTYFQDYEFKNNHFDMVVAGFSLHHCHAKDKQFIFRQINKALSPNGVFSYSDLMVNRKAKEHQSLLENWNKFVVADPSHKETWDWIMDHYKTYDHPDSLDEQLKWLKEAHFINFKISIYDKHWVHLKAFKNQN